MQIKKYRKLERMFLVEGAKSIQELLVSDYNILSIYVTDSFYKSCENLLAERQGTEVQIVSARELESAGTFESNDAGIAIVAMKENKLVQPENEEFALILDDVRDPGNLGTIVRIADWYGINKLILSENTADIYNPKVIASSMGSFTRVSHYYGNLEALLAGNKLPVYGAYLEGKSIHEESFSKQGYLLMGSESHGIRENLRKYVSNPVTIPGYGKAESLNVAIATAVILDNIRR